MQAVADAGFNPLPPAAAWHHRGQRVGFEVVFAESVGSGTRLRGHTGAVEDGKAWSVRYDITLDQNWCTIRAIVWGTSAIGDHETALETDGSGTWRIDGLDRPDLDGCFDVDLESSACTNMIPVHRMGLTVGEQSEAPAAYVRALDLGIERLEQRYQRAGDDDHGHRRYDYTAPGFDFECRLVYDRSGLVLQYPGIASRAQ